MLLYEFGAFYKVNLAICLDEIIAHRVYVVYDHKLDILLLNSLGQVEEDLVVVLNVLAELHDDVVADSCFSDNWLVLNQKVLFHLVEALLVQMLPRDHKERLAT